MIWRLLYSGIAMPLMTLGLLLGGLFSAKVRRGIKGRLGEGDRLRIARSRCRDDRPRVVVHCASAGELESAIPLMEEMIEQNDVDVLLTYYSPSAVDRASKIKLPVDHVYLPVDSLRRTRRFLDTIDPSLILFVKHDIWPNLVWEAKKRGVPTALVNGNFRPDSKRLKRVAIPFGRAVLPKLAAIFAVARDDAHRFRFLAGKEPLVEVSGDTRFDRVRQRALAGRADQGALADRLVDRPVAIAGSTWPADETLLLEAWEHVKREVPGAVLVLVPHEPTGEHVKQILQGCDTKGFLAVTLTEVEGGVPVGDVIVVDRVGVLAGLYGLGSIAYVGGAFGTGVHSVIEPAVFGMPVLFGPKYLMSHEARDLLALGAAKSISDATEIGEAFVNALLKGEESVEMGEKAAHFVEEHAGVSQRVASSCARLAGW